MPTYQNASETASTNYALSSFSTVTTYLTTAKGLATAYQNSIDTAHNTYVTTEAGARSKYTKQANRLDEAYASAIAQLDANPNFDAAGYVQQVSNAQSTGGTGYEVQPLTDFHIPEETWGEAICSAPWGIVCGVGETLKEMIAVPCDDVRAAFHVATGGYREDFHPWSNSGQALLDGSVSTGDYYKTFGSNVLTLGVAGELRAIGDCADGKISKSECIKQVGSTAVFQAAPFMKGAAAKVRGLSGLSEIARTPEVLVPDTATLPKITAVPTEAIVTPEFPPGTVTDLTSNVYGNMESLISPERTGHILIGEELGRGGHAVPGNPGKSQFPANWSQEKIVQAVSDVATRPGLEWFVQTGNGGLYTRAGDPAKFVTWGYVDGIRIKVVIEPAPTGRGIVTAFPDP